jgi:hypothetical protein
MQKKLFIIFMLPFFACPKERERQRKGTRAILSCGQPALLGLAENPQPEDRIFYRQALRCSSKWQWGIVAHKIAANCRLPTAN